MSRMFSGFKSQWISLAFLSTFSESISCCANTRTRLILNPLKLLRLISSYRLLLNSSNTRHRCCLCTKRSFNFKRLCESVGSTLVLRCSRIDTSIMLCLRYAGLFFMTLTATISFVFMFWHLTTWPNVPWPKTSSTKYRRCSSTPKMSLTNKM